MARNVYICAHAPMRCVSGHFCAGAGSRNARRALPGCRTCECVRRSLFSKLYLRRVRYRAPRPAGTARRRKGAQGVASRAVPWAWESVTSRRWRGARARGTAGRVPGTQDPREGVSRDWRTHIIRRHAGADRPETRPGHEMYTARDITHPGAAQPRITSSSTRADGHRRRNRRRDAAPRPQRLLVNGITYY